MAETARDDDRDATEQARLKVDRMREILETLPPVFTELWIGDFPALVKTIDGTFYAVAELDHIDTDPEGTLWLSFDLLDRNSPDLDGLKELVDAPPVVARTKAFGAAVFALDQITAVLTNLDAAVEEDGAAAAADRDGSAEAG